MTPLSCLFGHDFRITGHLNADQFSWCDARIGAYEACRCGAWRLRHQAAENAVAETAIAIFLMKGHDTPVMKKRIANHIS